MRLFVLRMLLFAAPGFTLLSAQAGNGGQRNNPPAANRQESRAERGRQFLGLAPPPDAAAAARGEKLFVATCGFCHGSNAKGAEGPDLLRSTIVLHDEKGELIGPVILQGRPDKGMPSFSGMTPAQIYDVAEFLHARVEAAANRYEYKLQNVVTGNAKAGEAFFNGPGECNTCHSPTGDLAHIASKFQPADLQAQFLYPSQAYSSGTIKGPEGPPVTVTLPSGETITGRLKRMDDFDVSIYDSAGAYRSWPRGEVKLDVKDPLEKHRELLAQYTDADMHNVLAYLETLK